MMWSFWLIKDENNKILLVLRNDYDVWNLPWWQAEKGETPWEVCIREVKEETWLDVEIIKLIWIYSKTQSDDLVFTFECRIVAGAITLNNEAKDIQYFDNNNLPENLKFSHRERIEDFFKEPKEIIMKAQIPSSIYPMI